MFSAVIWLNSAFTVFSISGVVSTRLTATPIGKSAWVYKPSPPELLVEELELLEELELEELELLEELLEELEELLEELELLLEDVPVEPPLLEPPPPHAARETTATNASKLRVEITLVPLFR